MPLSLLIDGNMNALVACLSLFLMFPSATTLCFLFVPKVSTYQLSVRPYRESPYMEVAFIPCTSTFTHTPISPPLVQGIVNRLCKLILITLRQTTANFHSPLLKICFTKIKYFIQYLTSFHWSSTQ